MSKFHNAKQLSFYLEKIPFEAYGALKVPDTEPPTNSHGC